MQDDPPLVTIIRPDGRSLPWRRRRTGALRIYGPDAGPSTKDGTSADRKPRERRRHRRGSGDLPPGFFLDVES